METRQDLTTRADRIAGSIDQFERRLDHALADFGQLLHELAAGRAASNLPASYGHDVFEAAVPALSSIISARSCVVGMHDRLTVVQRHQRVTLTTPPTDKGPTFASASPLRAVDSVAA